MIAQANDRPGEQAERILVLGAGWVGATLVQQMLRSPESPFLPVGFLDDDPAKRNLQIHGVRVLGRFADLATVAARVRGHPKVVVAVNDADSALMREISDAAHEAGLGCLVHAAVEGRAAAAELQLSALRDVDVEDVIGRQPVDTDVASIARLHHGSAGAGHRRRWLDRCRAVPPAAPVRPGRADHARPRRVGSARRPVVDLRPRPAATHRQLALADIRDPAALGRYSIEHKPDVVFHAAALKHLHAARALPARGVQDNVIGTLNVLEAAVDAGVGHFVNVSTDKAAEPTSALGHSKRLAERLTAWYAVQYADAGSCRCASATCWAAAAPCCTPSPHRSSAAARLPSPTQMSPATS